MKEGKSYKKLFEIEEEVREKVDKKKEEKPKEVKHDSIFWRRRLKDGRL